MAILSDYTTGTISIANGSTTVTGVNTAWTLAELQEGDLILVNNRSAVIQSVNSATSITITRPWTDTAVPAGTPYRARYMADAARYTAIAKALLTMLASGNVEALAGLIGAADKLPYFTGAATMGLADFTALGRSIVNKANTLALLAAPGPLGPVLGGVAPAPSEAGVGMADGDFNTVIYPGVYTIAGSWTNGYNGAAAAAYTGILMVLARKFNNLYYQFYYQGDLVWARSSSAPTTSWTTWTQLTQETAAGEFLKNKTIANNSPQLFFRDTDTGAEAQLNGASAAGSFFINVDRTNLFPNSVLGLQLSGTTKLTLSGTSATLTTPLNINSSGDGANLITFATERAWTVRQRGTGSAAQLSFENIQNKAVEFSSETSYTGPQISLLPYGGVSTQILNGNTSNSGHTTPSYSFQGATGTGFYGYNTTTIAFASAGSRIGYMNSIGLTLGERLTTSSATPGIGLIMNASNGTILSFGSTVSSLTVLQCYLDSANTPTVAGRLLASTSGGGTLSLATGSDHRMKTQVENLVDVQISAEDFATMSPSLLRLLSLRPVSYYWGDEPDLKRGFIAHEMQPILPHAVFGEKDAMKEYGTAVRKGAVIPAYTVKEAVEKTIQVPVEIEVGGELKTVMVDQVIMEYVDRVVPEQVEPDEVFEYVLHEDYPDCEWTKTHEEMDLQAVDHAKIIPDLVAAVQELSMIVLEERREKQALETRLAAIEAQLGIA
ncbi:putative tail protein [Sinorhizobium phage HMSP1-Susan]|nr:putative tail protein [Sinorhizobium phage HMSP1-Susan]